MSYADAARYVGTDPVSGLVQFALCVKVGLRPEGSVLEIGCGALHAARPLLAYLETGTYVGIDPNDWLRDAARAEDEYLDWLCARARFSSRPDFRARAGKFDVVLSHSVLSHASREQLREFMAAVAEQLAPGGTAVVSLHLARETTATDEWTYPDAVAFDVLDVEAAARAVGLRVSERPEFRTLMLSYRPDEWHRWVTVTRA